jgi:hypothetical protein
MNQMALALNVLQVGVKLWLNRPPDFAKLRAELLPSPSPQGAKLTAERVPTSIVRYISPNPGTREKGTACLPCSKWHFSGAAQNLEEALRFARKEGMNHPEVLTRVQQAGNELVGLERGDLTPEKLDLLEPGQRQVAEWGLQKVRELRHELDGLDQSQNVADLERAAVISQKVATEFHRRYWEIVRAKALPPASTLLTSTPTAA